MRKNLLNVIHAAVLFSIVLALPLMQSCSKCSTDHDGDKSVFDRITEEELAKFTPEPYTRGDGRSKAIDVQPRPEVHVTAPAGTFERAPEIKVTIPTDAEMSRLDNQMQRMTESTLLMAYDLDCGLGENEVASGRFLVEIDLEKLDIPETLWPYLTLYRADGKQKLQECNIEVKDGVLRYQACQNSGLIISATVFWSVSVGTGVSVFNYLVKRPGKNMTISAYWEAAKTFPDGLWKRKDVATLRVNDPFGKFNVRYRYSETELGADAEKYIAKKEELEALVDKIYEEAEEDFDKSHPELKPKLIPNWNVEERRRTGIYDLFLKNLGKNKKAQEIAQDPFMTTPQSVLDIIKGGRVALRFCRSEDGLNLAPLSYVFDVFYTNNDYCGEASKATATPIPMMGAFLMVNKDKFINHHDKTLDMNISSNSYYDTDQADAVILSMAHEISHIYEYTYLNFTPCRDMRFMEALGSLTEHIFSAWMKKHNYIDYDPESDYGDNRLDYADYTSLEFLSWPLAETLPDPYLDVSKPEIDCGYVLGRLVGYLREHNPKNKKISFDDMMKGYGYQKTFLQDMLDIFGFKNEQEFVPYYEDFCRENMALIVTKQKGYQGDVGDQSLSVIERRFGQDESKGKKEEVRRNNALVKTRRTKPQYAKYIPSTLFHAPYLCVMHFDQFGHNGTNRGKAFAVKTIRIMAEKEPEDKEYTPYSLFAVPSRRLLTSHMRFSMLEGFDRHYPKDSLYIPNPNKGFDSAPSSEKLSQYAVFITRPGFEYAILNSDYWVDFVALYRPMLDPIVKGRSKDGTGLLIDTRLEPCDDLLENGYVSGMKITIQNNKTKLKKTFNVKLDQCGKVVKIPYEKIDITDTENIDVSVATRWYYEIPAGFYYAKSPQHLFYSPPTKTVNFVRKKEVEEQNIEEKTDTAEQKADSVFIKPEKEDNAEEDLGGADINASFRLGQIEFNPDGYGGELFSYYEKDREEVNVFGRLVVKNGKFKLTIPAHKYPYDGGESGLGWHNLGPITLEGSCKLEKRMEDGVEVAKFTFNTDTEDYSLTPFGWEYAWVYKDPYPYYPDGIHITTYNRSYKITPVSDYHMNPFGSGYLTIKDGKLPDSFIIDCMVHYSFTVSPDDSNSSKESDMKMQIYGLFK